MVCVCLTCVNAVCVNDWPDHDCMSPIKPFRENGKDTHTLRDLYDFLHAPLLS